MDIVNKIKDLSEKYKKNTFLLYILIGFFGLFVDIGSYVLLTDVFKMSPYIANFIAVFVTLNNNYYWNTFINFKKKDKKLIRWMLFMTIGLIGLFVSEVFFYFFIEVWDLNDLFAKCATIPIIAVVQYLLHNKYTYK